MTARRIVKSSLEAWCPRLIKHWQHRRLAGIYQRAGLVYSHIAKAGGTSIVDSVFRRPVGHRSIRQVRKICPAQVAQFPVFTVVRNPWDRLYSAYNHAKRGGGSDTDASSRFSYHDGAFRSFDRFIVHWLARKDVGAIDMIFRPQHWFLGGSEDVKLFDHIGRLENLDVTVSWIGSQTGQEIKLRHCNRTSPVTAEGEIEVSARAFDAVRKLYKMDFDLLQYPVELPRRFRLAG